VVYESYPLTNLSVQQFIDCCPAFSNQCFGCNGDNFDGLFLYAINFGVVKEDDYPYQGEDGNCKFDQRKSVAFITDFAIINAGDEDEVTRVLAENSPIATALDATDSTFMYYTGGVYHGKNCRSILISHGMLLIGYGVDSPTNEKYYTLKNTWGTDWGESGYMRIIRDGSNNCGVAEKLCKELDSIAESGMSCFKSAEGLAW